MKILLVNDDGINSDGFRQLAKALGEHKHEVYVVAPEAQRSGYSHFISFRAPIYFSEEKVDGAIKAYSITGTPADCVKFALIHLNITPDLVISGPNQGANYGTDVIYSGTVSAAQEACLMGYKSVALSCRQKKGEFLFDTAIQYTIENLDKIMSFSVPYTFLNINFPSLPLDQIEGIKVARMGIYSFDDKYHHVENEGRIGYLLDGQPNVVKEEYFDNDVALVRKGYICITPIRTDRTDYDSITKVEELFI